MARAYLLCVLAIAVLVVGHSQANVILHDDTVDNSIAGSSDVIDLSHLGPDLYGEPDEEVGKLVANYNPATDSRNVEELGSYVEGDILIDRPGGRNGLSNTATRWPKGVVPFVISGNFDAKGMQLIEQAINEYHTKTCIRFVPRMGEKNYVSFETSNTGCWSSVGMVGGKQAVNLQIPGCTTLVGTVMHEMMHALGFLHEQNREDRDDWVKILYENIKSGTKNNFEKATKGSTNNFGVSYDYGSIMHYSSNAFSTNGRSTIEAKKPLKGAQMGQRDGFSWNDMEKLNRMYKCQGSKGNEQTFIRPPVLGIFPSTGVSGPAGPANTGSGPYFPPSGSGPYTPYYPPNGGPMYPYAPYPAAGFPGPGFGYYPYDVNVGENGEATKKEKSNNAN